MRPPTLRPVSPKTSESKSNSNRAIGERYAVLMTASSSSAIGAAPRVLGSSASIPMAVQFARDDAEQSTVDMQVLGSNFVNADILYALANCSFSFIASPKTKAWREDASRNGSGKP